MEDSNDALHKGPTTRQALQASSCYKSDQHNGSLQSWKIVAELLTTQMRSLPLVFASNRPVRGSSLTAGSPGRSRDAKQTRHPLANSRQGSVWLQSDVTRSPIAQRGPLKLRSYAFRLNHKANDTGDTRHAFNNMPPRDTVPCCGCEGDRISELGEYACAETP